MVQNYLTRKQLCKLMQKKIEEVVGALTLKVINTIIHIVLQEKKKIKQYMYKFTVRLPEAKEVILKLQQFYLKFVSSYMRAWYC